MSTILKHNTQDAPQIIIQKRIKSYNKHLKPIAFTYESFVKSLLKGNIVIWKKNHSLSYISYLQYSRYSSNFINKNLNCSGSYNAILIPVNKVYKNIRNLGTRKAKNFKFKDIGSKKIILGTLASSIRIKKTNKKQKVKRYNLLFLFVLNNNFAIKNNKNLCLGGRLKILGHVNLNFTPVRYYPAGGDKLKNLAPLVSTIPPSTTTAAKQQLTSGTASSETSKKPEEVETSAVKPSEIAPEIPAVKPFYDPQLFRINNIRNKFVDAVFNKTESKDNESSSAENCPTQLPVISLVQRFRDSLAVKKRLYNLAKAMFGEESSFSTISPKEESINVLEEATKTSQEPPNSIQNKKSEHEMLPRNSSLQIEGIGKKQTIQEQYANILATVQTIKDYPEELGAVVLIHNYNYKWTNLNVQALQSLLLQLHKLKLIGRKFDVLRYIKDPGKFEKELSAVLIKEPNTVDEVLSLIKMPTTLTLRFVNTASKKKLLQEIKKNFEIVDRTNNTNHDVYLIYNNKAIAVDIKRLGSNFSGLSYDEIHAITRNSSHTKTKILIQKIQTLFTEKIKERNSKNELISEEEHIKENLFFSRLEELEKAAETKTPECLTSEYNEIIAENLDLFFKYNICFTFTVCVDKDDFKNIPAEIIYKHKQYLENATNCTTIKNLDTPDENDLHKKAITFVDTTIIKDIITYVYKNNDDT